MATGTISSIGIGSTLDANSIISKLMDIEKKPLLQVQSAASTITAKISAFGTIQSDLSALGDAARKLTSVDTWSSTLATSADPTSVTVSATSSAAAGAYAISVQSLAAQQSTVSPAYASGSTAVGSGTLTIQVGSLNNPPTAFTAKSTLAAINISVLSTDTVTTLAQKINAAGAGVSASVVTDNSGARLIISAMGPGSDNAFKVTTTDSDGNDSDATGLSALAIDPSQTGQASSVTQLPADAVATVNGLKVTSSSNTLTNVVQGLTINLLKASTSTPSTTAGKPPIYNATAVTVAPDTAGMKTAVQGFVTAFNTLASEISTDTAYDATNKTSSILTGDNTARSIERQLRSVLGNSSSASSLYSTLSSAGIEFSQDASTKLISLKINDTKLDATLSNVAESKKLFSGDGADDSSKGFARRVSEYTDQMLGIDGVVSTRTSGLRAQLAANEKRQDDLSQLNDATESRLQAQYSALDSKMASLNALSAYVTQQVTTWNKNTS